MDVIARIAHYIEVVAADLGELPVCVEVPLPIYLSYIDELSQLNEGRPRDNVIALRPMLNGVAIAPLPIMLWNGEELVL